MAKANAGTVVIAGEVYTKEAYPRLFQEDGSAHTVETKPGLFKADGSQRKPVNYSSRVVTRRPNEEVIASLIAKKTKISEHAARVIAKLDARIAKLQTKGGYVDPETAFKAASELLGAGWTPDSLAAMEAQIKAAKAALKGKTDAEVAAMVEAAIASKTAAVTYDEPEDGEAE